MTDKEIAELQKEINKNNFIFSGNKILVIDRDHVALKWGERDMYQAFCRTSGWVGQFHKSLIKRIRKCGITCSHTKPPFMINPKPKGMCVISLSDNYERYLFDRDDVEAVVFAKMGWDGVA